nr:DNA-binding protein [Clostridium aceticum]
MNLRYSLGSCSKEASLKWGISERRIQKLCVERRIPGVVRFVRVWAIPKEAEKPADGRYRKHRQNKI